MAACFLEEEEEEKRKRGRCWRRRERERERERKKKRNVRAKSEFSLKERERLPFAPLSLLLHLPCSRCPRRGLNDDTDNSPVQRERKKSADVAAAAARRGKETKEGFFSFPFFFAFSDEKVTLDKKNSLFLSLPLLFSPTHPLSLSSVSLSPPLASPTSSSTPRPPHAPSSSSSSSSSSSKASTGTL